MSDYYFYKQEEKIKSARKNSNVSESAESESHPQLKNALRRKPKTNQELIQFPQSKIQYVSAYIPEPMPLPEAIKQIDKKILAYKKVLEIAKKQKEQQERQKYLETEAEQLNINKQSLDFLTNPQIQVKNLTGQEQFQFQKDDQKHQIEDQDQLFNQTANKDDKKNKKQTYLESVRQREKFYDDTLEILQMKRQNPAFFAKLKKKTPALNITTKNKIQPGGGRLDLEEHQLRVFNRENVPTIPKLIIPTFMKKKDNISKNILAYLKDYSPLYNKNESQEYPKCILNLLLGDEKDSNEKNNE